MSDLRVEILNGLATVDPAAWDGLVGDGLPFVEWGWLASLEEAGCVGTETGWLPQHLALYEGDRLIGACPLYVKGHSQGEFVFDHGWAEAAARAGLRYYPKLLVASPFTPATGVRFLAAPGADRAHVTRVLGSTLQRICHEGPFSSVHVNFCLPEEVEALSALGYERRTGYQFQWESPGWRDFDDYLEAFRSKRRNQIKRERRELLAQDVEIMAYVGAEIPDELFGPMFELYTTTVDKFYWGHRYLNAELFELLRRRWKHRLCFIVARRRGRLIAGTVNVRKGPVLYGRYWGTFEDLRHLHFNVCYYAAIELCLREGITRFEPGAGGAFKYLRGFDARATDSMHHVDDPRFADAVRRYLAQERKANAEEVAWLEERSALKR
jgi:predicted N-acyltransferase